MSNGIPDARIRFYLAFFDFYAESLAEFTYPVRCRALKNPAFHAWQVRSPVAVRNGLFGSIPKLGKDLTPVARRYVISVLSGREQR